jgi:hypothetical protein
MKLARVLLTFATGLMLPGFSKVCFAQGGETVPQPPPPLEVVALETKEPLPSLKDLIAKARSAAAARQKRKEVLQFEGQFEMRSGATTSSRGRVRVWGAKDFRYECDLPNGPICIRYRFESDAERVLWQLQQLDVKGSDEVLIGQGYRAEAWKDAEADARRALMGLLFLFAPEPPRLLEIAARRWADLKVVGLMRELDGSEVWRVEAVLPPHEVPEAYRVLELARVRLHLGREDLVLRRHELLFADGQVYKSNRLSQLQWRAPEGEPPPRLEVPAGFEIGPMLNPEERAGG